MKLLIIDDDKSVVDTVTAGLQSRWQDAAIYSAANGEQGLQVFAELAPDLVVLDVSMPKMDGFELLEQIRKISDTPVLMLTGRGDDASRVNGLELGADDYLLKPFSPRELSARVRVLLRRAGTPPDDQVPTLTHGDLTIDFVSREVFVGGEKVSLTPTEYRLLYELAINAGRVVPAEDLLTTVWGPGYRNDLNSLKIYISRLRKKLGDDPRRPRYVHTERSAGYKFASPDRAPGA